MSLADTRKQFPMLNFCPTTSSLLHLQIAHYAYGMSKTTCRFVTSLLSLLIETKITSWTNLKPWPCCSILTLRFQVRTFRGHTNEKNFVGLTVNSEYLACGSETNEVYVYHKVHKSEISSSKTSTFCGWSKYLGMWMLWCRRSRDRWHHTGLEHQTWMMQRKRRVHTSLVRFAGRVIVPRCWLRIVKEPSKFWCSLRDSNKIFQKIYSFLNGSIKTVNSLSILLSGSYI